MFGEDDTAKKREAISSNSFEKIDPKGIAPLLNSNQNLEETLERRDKSFEKDKSQHPWDMATNQQVYNPNSAVLQKLATENNSSSKNSKKNINTFSISQIKQLEVQKSLGTKSKDIELEG